VGAALYILAQGTTESSVAFFVLAHHYLFFMQTTENNHIEKFVFMTTVA
jgi:hypothetical protein